MLGRAAKSFLRVDLLKSTPATPLCAWSKELQSGSAGGAAADNAEALALNKESTDLLAGSTTSTATAANDPVVNKEALVA